MIDEIAPHIVITDMQMPKLDGLGLVDAVRSHHSDIPIILVTGRGSEGLAAEALQRGAASYVSKSELAKRLSETIKQVLQVAESDRSYQRLIKSLDCSQFTLTLDNDPWLIPPLVSLVQEMAVALKVCDTTEERHLAIALDEALINAMYHGNLELPADQIREVRNRLREGRVSSLIESRRSVAPYSDRQVHVEITLQPECARVVVRDQGSGFDPATIPDPSDSLSDEEAGRGLVLIKTFMDEVKFGDMGNEITMVKRRR